MIDIGPSRLIEKTLGVFSIEGHQLEVRTAQRRAVYGVVETRVLPDGSEDAVLDVVEAHRMAFDFDPLLLPRSEAQPAGSDLANARDGVVIENHANRESVVEIDPVGQLFRPGQGRDLEPTQAAHVIVEGLVVLLGGKRVIVQPENEKPTCVYGRIFLNERIYGSPVGLVMNVDKLDRPILDVTPFFHYLAASEFSVSLVYEVVNRGDGRRTD